MAVKDYSEIDKYWSRFVEDGHVFKIQSASEAATPGTPPPLLYGNSYKQDMQILSNYLSGEGKRRLQARFKNWKSRHKLNKTTITVSGEVLDRLRAYARASGLAEDNYDLTLEILLDPEERSVTSKAKAELEDNDQLHRTSLKTESDYFSYITAKTRHIPRLSRHLKTFVNLIYKRGWNDCRAVKGRKTESAFAKHSEDFKQEFEL